MSERPTPHKLNNCPGGGCRAPHIDVIEHCRECKGLHVLGLPRNLRELAISLRRAFRADAGVSLAVDRLAAHIAELTAERDAMKEHITMTAKEHQKTYSLLTNEMREETAERDRLTAENERLRRREEELEADRACRIAREHFADSIIMDYARHDEGCSAPFGADCKCRIYERLAELRAIDERADRPEGVETTVKVGILAGTKIEIVRAPLGDCDCGGDCNRPEEAGP